MQNLPNKHAKPTKQAYKTYQTSIQNLTYKTKPTIPNLSKTTELQFMAILANPNPNCVKVKLSKDRIKFQLVEACHELGTAQPQLV